MKHKIDIPDDLSRRLDALAARSSLTRDAIIADALARGRSIAWQERWIAGVEDGIADADRGNFAAEPEITAVLGKYGPA